MDVPIKYNVKDEFQYLTSTEIKELYESKSNDHSIVCLNQVSDTNIGLMIRTASIYGMSKVYIMGRRKFDRRSSVGTHHIIPVIKESCSKGVHSELLDTDKIITNLQILSKEYSIVFIEQSKIAIDVRNIRENVSYTKPVLFVVGSEGKGIPCVILDSIQSICITIPQNGIGRSHNVAIALATVLYEFFRN